MLAVYQIEGYVLGKFFPNAGYQMDMPPPSLDQLKTSDPHLGVLIETLTTADSSVLNELLDKVLPIVAPILLKWLLSKIGK